MEMPKYNRQGKGRGLRITLEGLRFLYKEHTHVCRTCRPSTPKCEIGKKLFKDANLK